VPDDEETGVPVTIRVASIEQVPFGPITKGAVLNEVCSRINFAIYSGTGEKPNKIQKDQVADNPDFGTLNIPLEEGTYTLVVLAHNGDGNPTMTVPAKTSFSNKKTAKVTDTFLYCSQLEVKKDMQPVNVELERVVSKLELNLTDDSIPEPVKKLQVDINGASQSLNLYTGLGLNSNKITEIIDVVPGNSQYGLYLFVREGHSTMTVTVSALDSLNQEYNKLVLENIPIEKNKITRCTGQLFKKATYEAGMQVSINSDWSGTVEKQF
jgi:hypothetical protein